MRKARSLRVGASTASVGQSVGHAGGCRVAAVRKARRALERRSAQRAEGWCERGGWVAVATQVGDDNARVRRANAKKQRKSRFGPLRPRIFSGLQAQFRGVKSMDFTVF
jgi:hypothetical protein